MLRCISLFHCAHGDDSKAFRGHRKTSNRSRSDCYHISQLHRYSTSFALHHTSLFIRPRSPSDFARHQTSSAPAASTALFNYILHKDVSQNQDRLCWRQGSPEQSLGGVQTPSRGTIGDCCNGNNCPDLDNIVMTPDHTTPTKRQAKVPQ